MTLDWTADPRPHPPQLHRTVAGTGDTPSPAPEPRETLGRVGEPGRRRRPILDRGRGQGRRGREGESIELAGVGSSPGSACS